ncbi:chaperonin 10-like protein [Ilyonectria robusta]|uniref:chaperonin 10-like protein n=1 Tax=Ilyonectria robusta TaxID=1079257 RepID=UPI001E8EC087|nr:chaperonin 10-like protein [Ilyonectria robusta]KAH8688107.1 chaperonin 10-like protein [Ilyonectria robusta]
MASQNTKYLVQGQGGPLVMETTAKPAILEPTEILIRLKAIAINPADCKMIDQGHRITSWPLVPGLDGAGIVEAVGANVKDFWLGDRVLALFTPGNRSGSYQTFAVVQERTVAKIPTTWSFEDAATLGVCYMTGIVALGIGLRTSLPFLKDGPTTEFSPASVLVLGGSSALGAATIQLLRLAAPDCTILATSSAKHHSTIINTLGADRAFDRNSASLVMDVRSASPGSRGVDAIIDAVGAGGTQPDVFDTFEINGPKKYAQVWTGHEEIKVPTGVNSVMFRGRDLPNLQGGENIMQTLQELLEHRKYKLHSTCTKWVTDWVGWKGA